MTTPLLQVRPMRPDELSQACEILIGQGICQSEGLKERLEPIIGSDLSDCLVAESEQGIVGVVFATFNGFSHFLSSMAVMPGQERHGIGGLLLDELVRRAQARGAQNIVVASWLTAAGFYFRHAFRMPGAVFMVRDI
jgi:GNAT superfamily N-acetyltransferase